MSTMRLASLWFFTALIFTGSCGKHSDQASEHADPFVVPMTAYPISNFTNFPTFQGKLLNKHIGSYLEKTSRKTNYFFTIFLEKTNGDQFAVSDNPTPQAMFQIVNSLENNHSYSFPDVLTNGNSIPGSKR